MQLLPTSSRAVGVLTLAVAAALLAPGAALAETTPSSPTTTTSPAPTATGTSSTTTASTTTPTTTDPATTTPSAPTSTTTAAPTTKAVSKTSSQKPKSEARASALSASALPQSDAAAAFIARTLADGGDHYVYPKSTFFDGGNTIDALVALDEAGGQQAQSNATYAYLVGHLGDYVGTGGETYAGPLGKAVIGIVTHGADPTSVAGQDLVARLRKLERANGRFSDASAYGDYSNTIGHALDLIALSRAGSPLTAASVSYLLGQQCADGGFRGDLAGTGCSGDPDATSFAAQALVSARDALICGPDATTVSRQLETALPRALNRLEALQGGSGGLASADGVQNANTTGVAAQALYAGGRDSAADRAAAFITTLQYDVTAPSALQGGIAFSAATRSTTAPSDSDLRATPQAALALAGSSLVDAGAPNAPRATVCPAIPSPSTSTTTTASRPAGAAATTTSAAPAPADPPVASATPGSLAFTGADIAVTTVLGLLLLLAGVGAIVLARRKGAHA